MPESGKIQINCVAIEKLFQAPFEEYIFAGPANKSLKHNLQALRREMITNIFELNALVYFLNWSKVPREKLLKIRKINFTIMEEFTLNVDLKTREVLAVPTFFFYPASLAEELNWGIGFLDYQDSFNKNLLNAQLSQYIADCIKSEVTRRWLVDDFHQMLEQKQLSNKTFQEYLTLYLCTRKQELEFTAKLLPGWKQFLPAEMIEKWEKHNSVRLEKFIQLSSQYGNNSAPVVIDAKDAAFLRGDIITKSFSDCSFQSNSFDNIISIYQDKDYAMLYSLCFGHFYSARTMSTGFICPGYNQFRQYWTPVFGTPPAGNKPISADDFFLSFDDDNSIAGKFYLLFSVNALD